jgi:hypothetical protein
VEWGVETVRDFVELSAVILATGSVLIGVRAYLTSRDHLRLGVVSNCVARFQALLPSLDSQGLCEPKDVRAYLDLCNEELFYVKHRYVPEEVALEWIDGMLQMLPALRPGGDEAVVTWPAGDGVLPGCADLVRSFPRLVDAFTFEAPPELESPASRRPYVKHVVRRAREYSY